MIWIRSETAALLTVTTPGDTRVATVNLTTSREHDGCVSTTIEDLRNDTMCHCAFSTAAGARLAAGEFRTASEPSMPSRCMLVIGACASESFPGGWPAAPQTPAHGRPTLGR